MSKLSMNELVERGYAVTFAEVVDQDLKIPYDWVCLPFFAMYVAPGMLADLDRIHKTTELMCK